MIGEMNANEAYEALINNSLDWYIAEYIDGTYDLKHNTALSSIMQCGADPSKWGISELHQCWNGEEIGECPFSDFDSKKWDEDHPDD